MALNSPSKNCVAQCTFGLVAGLVKVTMVPTGTRMWVGAIAFTAVDSVAPTTPVAERVRARNTVFGGVRVAPSTGLPETGRRTTGGVGVAACASVPPTLNAHRWSPRGAESPYGRPVPPVGVQGRRYPRAGRHAHAAGRS